MFTGELGLWEVEGLLQCGKSVAGLKMPATGVGYRARPNVCYQVAVTGRLDNAWDMSGGSGALWEMVRVGWGTVSVGEQ